MNNTNDLFRSSQNGVDRLRPYRRTVSPDRLGPIPVVQIPPRTARGRSARRTSAAILVLRVMLCAAVALILFFFITVEVDAGQPAPPDITLVVAEGDSLWSIAQSFAKNGDDVRQLVAEIRSSNNLASSVLQVGQRITVPATLGG